MTDVRDTVAHGEQSQLRPVLWGLGFGAILAASPLAVCWLDQAAVHALYMSVIAAFGLKTASSGDARVSGSASAGREGPPTSPFTRHRHLQ